MFSSPEMWKEFFERYYRDEVNALAGRSLDETETPVLYVDVMKDLVYFHEMRLMEELFEYPDAVIGHAEEGLALADNIFDVQVKGKVRFVNLPATRKFEIRQIRSKHAGKFITVEGMVRKATKVYSLAVKATFRCKKCGNTVKVTVDSYSRIPRPEQCRACKGRGFEMISSERVDFQRLEIQEYPENLKGGETPQTVQVFLKDDLVGRVFPGSRIVVNGTARLNEQNGKAIEEVYIEANSIEVLEKDYEEITITQEDERKIRELSKDPKVYEKIVASIAPSIYGYEDVKLAIALQLFGGVSKTLPDGTFLRGDAHVLLVGDPGSGKCVDYDTRVVLADGSLEKIGDIVERTIERAEKSGTVGVLDDGFYAPIDLELYALDTKTFRVRKVKADAVWKGIAPKKMLRIRTASGREVRVTPVHPFFVLEDGQFKTRKAGELKIGDFIAVPRVIPVEGRVAVEGREGRAVRLCGKTMEKPKTAKAKFGSNKLKLDKKELDKEGSRELQLLERLAHSDIFWDRIEEIEEYTPKHPWVYDLHVPEHHNYIANDFFVHNTQLLRYVHNIAPRSVFSTGKGSSAAGLTASVARDDFDGKWTLEAGVLVLADKGVALVDEIDKMSKEDRNALHTALEQQIVAINKAGINAVLKSRCSLLAAANPMYGRFDRYTPIPEQIDLDPALLSRFDLIFTILDDPDEGRDRNLAKHILSAHRGDLGNFEPGVDIELLRKYIAYARRNVEPRLSEEAAKVIEDYYVSVRKRARENSPVPLTARQLEAIVRLAEASAKLRLSDVVTVEDANRAIDLVERCLKEVAVDPETGEVDIDIITTGTPKRDRDRIFVLKKIIEELESVHEKGAPEEEVLRMAEEEGIDASKAKDILDKLKDKGEVYCPRIGFYRLVTKR